MLRREEEAGGQGFVSIHLPPAWCCGCDVLRDGDAGVVDDRRVSFTQTWEQLSRITQIGLQLSDMKCAVKRNFFFKETCAR